MERHTPRVGLLVSVTVHIALMMLLLSVPVRRPQPISPDPEPIEAPRVVVMVPKETLRQLRPKPPVPVPATLAPPTAAVPTRLPDRVSVGAPSALRSKGPLFLKRDEDLTATIARGVRKPGDTLEPTPAPGVPFEPADGDGMAMVRPRSSFPPTPVPYVVPPPPTGPRSAGLGETLRDLDRRLGATGSLGLESGSGQQMGPLFFDPQGADFTQWYNHFRIDVYRNWIPPYAVFMYGGEVEFEFTVERDGRVSRLQMVRSTGNAALDRAAQNALIASRFLPLPADFGPPSVLMRVYFIYSARPSGS